MTALKLSKIRTDGGTQSRASLNDAVVEDYAQTVRDGTDFPAVVVFFDGKEHWLADGFHRVEAYRAAGAVEIEAEIHQGTRREAILYSVGANSSHGLRRTNDDKRRAVMTLLNDEEWSQWSDREIARQCQVSHVFVGKLRPVTGNVSSEPREYTTKHGTTAKMETANIGKAGKTEEKAARQAEQAKFDEEREQARAALPESIKQQQAAKEAAIEARQQKAERGADLLSQLQAENEELREANASLEAEVAALKADNAKWQDMKVQFEQGGFEKVVADLREENRVLLTRVETESRDKAGWKRSADMWRKRAEEAGWSNDIIIDINTGEVVNG
ncbi:hypothetical protein NO932_11680 [Pelagibacterium sp. 26DY04]|uniref:hypothetical protein n=1 Tax=Pelagibacterium sp. 26DY04 TaxID=2967130 RepID=UPI002815E3F9|nr:hypothetical protein [Pelagibacterium sp. 26DY04]WMT85588.1 hypothetical protein NO932_11680 [Pelagibacterium sp. 26DY04]